MKIAIIGTGAMGSVYAGLMGDAGHDVWAVDMILPDIDRAYLVPGLGEQAGVNRAHRANSEYCYFHFALMSSLDRRISKRSRRAASTVSGIYRG